MEAEMLTEPTRKLRKSLLVSSLIGFAISYAGLRVSEVSLLGSKLVITNFDVIPFVLGIIVLYFLVTFIIFGLYDYVISYIQFRRDIVERISKGGVSNSLEAMQSVKRLKDELTGLNEEMTLAAMTSQEKAEKIKEKIREVEKEIATMDRVVVFYKHNKWTVWERISFKIRIVEMKAAFDLVIPILVGIYVVILLFFFTKIPEPIKTDKEVTIGLRLSIDDANNITSYSLIEKPVVEEANEPEQIE